MSLFYTTTEVGTVEREGKLTSDTVNYSNEVNENKGLSSFSGFRWLRVPVNSVVLMNTNK